MKQFLLFVATLTCLSAQVFAQSELQRSHIEANVPPQEVIESYLQRDLLAYFKRVGSQVTVVEVLPLRNAPTQSGTAYPKFYLWVKVYAGAIMQDEGAVRVAAVQRTHFEVTDFLSKANIQGRPGEVGSIFPAALISAIHELAGVERK